MGDCHDYLATHDLPFEIGAGVILSTAVLVVMAGRFVWRQIFEPAFVIS